MAFFLLLPIAALASYVRSQQAILQGRQQGGGPSLLGPDPMLPWDPVPVRCVISGPILETHLHTP